MGAGKGTEERIFQANSWLSEKPNVGLDPMTHEIMTWAKINSWKFSHLSHWVPLKDFFFPSFYLFNLYTQLGTKPPDLQIKSHKLFQLTQPGTTGRFFFFFFKASETRLGEVFMHRWEWWLNERSVEQHGWWRRRDDHLGEHGAHANATFIHQKHLLNPGW